MAKFKMLSDEEIKAVFEEAKVRTKRNIEQALDNSIDMLILNFRGEYFDFSNFADYLCSIYNDIPSAFYENEMLKEGFLTEKNKKKIIYLTIREHYHTMREIESCTVDETLSTDSVVNGFYGEKLTVFELELMKMKNYKGNILFDLYIPTPDGRFAQIDMLFVSPKGVFVIESKNYSDTIIGNEYDEKWYIKKKSGYRNSYNKSVQNGFYNPVKQNQKHIEAVQYHFKGIPCFSLIVFSERCKLESINVSSKSAYVFNRYAMINVFSRIYNSNPDVFNDDMIKYITEQFRQYCDADDSIKKAHNDNIRDNVTHDYNSFEYFDDYDDYDDDDDF